MTIPDNTIGYGAALPGLDSADFDDEDTGRRLRRKLSAGGPSVGALMRAGVACALQWPVAQVLIDSITNEKGVTTTYTTQSKVNLVDIGCDGQEIVARRLAEDTPLLMDLPVGSRVRVDGGPGGSFEAAVTLVRPPAPACSPPS